MMMRKITQTQILEKIENEKDELTAVEIIMDSKDYHGYSGQGNVPLGTPERASIIFNDRLFSTGYEIEEGYTFDLLKTIKKALPENVLLLWFVDDQLPEAWRQAYQDGGILERFPDDRRLKFHPYNEMNEQFCIDRNLLWDITDEFKGTPHELTEDKCKYRFEIIKWYKNHLI